MEKIFVNEIEKDYSDYCLEKLKKVDPQYTSDSSDKCIWDYHRYQFRKILDVPRKVYVASDFDKQSPFQSSIEDILKKIEDGDSLLAYQSRQLKSTDYDDGLLMDWGVQHLHLGGAIENDGFISRTNELLFVRFTPDTAYVLGIFKHNEWSTLDILETIHDNWPESIEIFQVKNIVDISYCPDEDTIREFRKIGLNSAIKLKDGAVYMGPGGGITTAGTPLEVTQNVLELKRVFANAYNHITKEFDDICKLLNIEPDQEKISIGLNLSDGKLVYTLKELQQGIILA